MEDNQTEKGDSWETTRQRRGRVVGDYQTEKGVGDYQTEKGESGGRLPDRERGEWWETTRQRKGRVVGDYQR